jgi:hypothetical protein
LIGTLCGAGSVSPAGAGGTPPEDHGRATVTQDVDWRTSPLDLNLRGLNGGRFRFRCPPGKPAPGQVVGSGPYTDASSICAAAAHAGAIHAAAGGIVTLQIGPGRRHYRSSVRHYIHAGRYDGDWGGSFDVIARAWK